MLHALLMVVLAGPAPRLVPLAEVAQLKAAQDLRLAGYRAMTCPRPALWDGEKQTPGAGADAIVALMHPASPHAPCLAAAKALSQTNKETPEGRFPEATPIEESPSDAVKSAERACASLPAAIAKATRYADGCSPFLVGRRPLDHVMSAVTLSEALNVAARARLRAGDADGAARMLLDGVLLNQDLTRGGAPLLMPMVAVAGELKLLPTLVQALEQGAKPEPIVTALDRLIAADTHPRTIFLAEQDYTTLTLLRPDLEAKGWAPPGGWSVDQLATPTRPTVGPIETKVLGADVKDDVALAWVAAEETRAAWDAACPAGSDWVVCNEGIQAAGEALVKPTPRTYPEKAKMWARIALGGRAALRKESVQILKAVATPALSEYIDRLAGRRAALGYVRYLAAVKAANGRCVEEPTGLLALVNEKGGVQVRAAKTLVRDGAPPPLDHHVNCTR